MTTGQQLAALRSEWRYWRNPGRYGAPIDFCIGPCPARCSACEGCAMALYRGDRLAEIWAEADALKAAM